MFVLLNWAWILTTARYSFVFRRTCLGDNRYSNTNRAVYIMSLELLLSFLVQPDQSILTFFIIRHSLKGNRQLCKLIRSYHKRRCSTPYKFIYNYYFIRNLYFTFVKLLLITWLISLLLCCGDVHPNPVPISSGSCSSKTSISSVSLPPYDSHLGICHINIQSILPKIHILQYEMQTLIFMFSQKLC